MKIKEITYKRLVSTGNFENETLEAKCSIEENESPELALFDLKEWVDKMMMAKRVEYALEHPKETLLGDIKLDDFKLPSEGDPIRFKK